MSAEYSRQIDARGVIAGPDWLTLPATLYSTTGGFYRTVNTEEELLIFLQEHRATPGAFYDVMTVHAYYCERPGDLVYSASEFHIRSRYAKDAQGMMPGFEST